MQGNRCRQILLGGDSLKSEYDRPQAVRATGVGHSLLLQPWIASTEAEMSYVTLYVDGATKLGKYRIREYVGFPKMQNVKTIKRVFRLLVPLHEILFLTIANPYTRLDLILVDPSFDSSKFDEDYMALTLQPSEDMLGPRMWFLFDVEYRYVWNYSAMVFDLLKIAVGAALSLIVNALRKRASDR